MSTSQEAKSISLKLLENRDSEEEGRERKSMFDVIHGGMRERIVLQRLIVIARLPCNPADRTDLGAHYENLNFQLNKQYIWDHITGLLLIYPSCLLHIIESSRDILVSVVEDLKAMQQQPNRTVLEAKIVFMAHNPPRRLFQQWSCKVLNADQAAGDAQVMGLEEHSTETLVCSVLSALQKLGNHLEVSNKAPPGSVLDETPDLIISQKILDKLLGRDELQSPQQYLQMYNSPLNVSIEFGLSIKEDFVALLLPHRTSFLAERPEGKSLPEAATQLLYHLHYLHDQIPDKTCLVFCAFWGI